MSKTILYIGAGVVALYALYKWQSRGTDVVNNPMEDEIGPTPDQQQTANQVANAIDAAQADEQRSSVPGQLSVNGTDDDEAELYLGHTVGKAVGAALEPTTPASTTSFLTASSGELYLPRDVGAAADEADIDAERDSSGSSLMDLVDQLTLNEPLVKTPNPLAN